jgi:aspartate carbamoyltransferase catalytic subunit
MDISFRHLLSADQVTQEDIQAICKKASFFHHNTSPSIFDLARGKILASLFFEPSTRTRFAFEAAMQKLGGNIITLESGASSSTKKGETLSDTGRIMSGYCDIAVIRHPQKNSATEFATHATVPVINAGDGSNQHPSQSLLDIYTINHFHHRLDELSIGIVGDLKFSRTVKSLVQLLAFYKRHTFYLISHPSLKMNPETVSWLKQCGHQVIETESLHDTLPLLDIAYMTRVQEERFDTKESYDAVKNHYRLERSHLTHAKPTLTILHPLPRITEIAEDVDTHPSAKYFDQAQFGLYIRMALISEMLGLEI